jgi:hypothetical protein
MLWDHRTCEFKGYATLNRVGEIGFGTSARRLSVKFAAASAHRARPSGGIHEAFTA